MKYSEAFLNLILKGNIMRTATYILLFAGFAAATPVIAADAPASPHTVSGNFGLTTDYIFRGVSQTQQQPAVQGGFDYSHASGIYVGTWLSNVSWVKEGGFKNNSSLEVDLYGGYKGSVGDFGYDLGVITYYYPGNQVAGATDPDTTEVYVGASWKFVSLKYSRVVSDYFIGWGGPGGLGVSANQKTKGSDYLDLSVNYPVAEGWTVLAHAGHQKVKNYTDASYTDWKLGVSKDMGYGTVTLAYTDTNAKLLDADGNNVYIFGVAAPKKVAEGSLALSFLKTF
jgi:uncharacterized protein (TIGR02001 family)